MHFQLPPTPPYSADGLSDFTEYDQRHPNFVDYQQYYAPQDEAWTEPTPGVHSAHSCHYQHCAPPTYTSMIQYDQQYYQQTYNTPSEYAFHTTPLTPTSPGIPSIPSQPPSDYHATYELDPINFCSPLFTSGIHGNYPLPSTPIESFETNNIPSQEPLPLPRSREHRQSREKAHTAALAPSNSSRRKKPASPYQEGNSKSNRRFKTKFSYNPDAVYPTNSDHVFILHIQTRHTPEVNDKWVSRLTFVNVTPSESPLSRSIRENQPYTQESYEEDCARNSSYEFSNPNGNRFTVSYSLSGTTIINHDPLPPTVSPNATLSFIHFPPGTFVVSDHPIGSKTWWRIQTCNAAPQKHRGMPFPDGQWTIRYDAEDEEIRRPARVVHHFSTCKLRAAEGEFFALGKLARAIRSPLPREEGGI